MANGGPIYKGGRPYSKPGQRYAYNTGVFPLTGAPTNGTSGTLAGIAGPGSVVLSDTGAVYVNVGTKASPSWAPFGGGNASYERLITTRVLTAADNGKTFGLALATGFTVTLPDLSTVSGFKVNFVVEIAPTTAYIVSAATADLDKMAGQVYGADGITSGSNSVTTFTADQMNFVASASVIGDRGNIVQVGTAGWAGQGFTALGATGMTFTG